MSNCVVHHVFCKQIGSEFRSPRPCITRLELLEDLCILFALCWSFFVACLFFLFVRFVRSLEVICGLLVTQSPAPLPEQVESTSLERHAAAVSRQVGLNSQVLLMGETMAEYVCVTYCICLSTVSIYQRT